MKESSAVLQNAVNLVYAWTIKWRIKLNTHKSVHDDFTDKNLQRQQTLYNTAIPYANTAQYLGMTLYAKLRWKEHIKNKKEELQLKHSQLY